MAYNTLGPFDIDCPVCGTRSGHYYRFKTGSAYGTPSEYACEYIFGDRIPWWPKTDPRYPLWRKSNADYPAQDACDEWCDIQCPDCLSKLTVVIRFESLYIVGIVEVHPA